MVRSRIMPGTEVIVKARTKDPKDRTSKWRNSNSFFLLLVVAAVSGSSAGYQHMTNQMKSLQQEIDWLETRLQEQEEVAQKQKQEEMAQKQKQEEAGQKEQNEVDNDPLRIDRSGLLDSQELVAIQDIEKVLGKQLVFTSGHASWSSNGMKLVNKHVTQLSIKRSGLTMLPETIRSLKELTYLDLESNALTTLPDVFDELAKLETLDITGNPMVSLPPSLKKLKRPIEVKIGKKRGGW
jgi:Leucine-rich repeat (LRR) protein